MDTLLLRGVESAASVPRGILGEETAFLAGFALGVQKELLSSTHQQTWKGNLVGFLVSTW